MNTAPFPRMHVSLYVTDIQETVSFYETFFGQPATKIKPGYAKFLLHEPALLISFVENKELAGAKIGHLGFQVEHQAALDAYQSRLEKVGMPLLEERNTTCCYAEQDKFWVQDPDGYPWEVYVFNRDAEFSKPPQPNQSEGFETLACCVPKSESNLKAEKSCC